MVGRYTMAKPGETSSLIVKPDASHNNQPSFKGTLNNLAILFCSIQHCKYKYYLVFLASENFIRSIRFQSIIGKINSLLIQTKIISLVCKIM